MHNTSDGLDLFYHTLGGTITLERVYAEGNAGNQVKVAGATAITNSVMVGNYTYFEGQPFTYNVDPCRAQGNTLHNSYTGGERVSIVNTTFYGHGDGLLNAVPREGYQCNGTESLTGTNNIFRGDAEILSPGDITFLFYQEDCGDLKLQSDFSVAYNVKNNEPAYVDPVFPSAHNILADPQLLGPLSRDEPGMNLSAGSPAIDSGDNTTCPTTDIRGNSRPIDGDGDKVAVCDMGAYEWNETAAPDPAPVSSFLYLPLTMLRN